MFNYDALNPRIRETVKWLHELGWSTCDSGDGSTNEYSCDWWQPYAVVDGHVSNAPIDDDAVHQIYSEICERLGGPPAGVTVERSYALPGGRAFVVVNGLHDGMLKGGE